MRFLLLLLLMPAFCLNAFPYNSTERIDYDKIDQRLFQEQMETGDKTDAEIYEAMGYAYLNEYNLWERATVYFKKATELDPTLYTSWYNLGLIYIDDEEGSEYFKKTIEARPDFAPPYYWIAYSHCRHYRDIEAIPAWKKYLEVAEAGNDPAEQGRIKVARKVLEELLAGEEGENVRKLRHPMGRLRKD